MVSDSQSFCNAKPFIYKLNDLTATNSQHQQISTDTRTFSILTAATLNSGIFA